MGEPVEPIIHPEVPTPTTMSAALEQAVSEYQEPPQKPVSRPEPALTARQDQLITRMLWQADVDPEIFRVNHDPRNFLRGDGSLDETKLAVAIVATAHMINEGRK